MNVLEYLWAYVLVFILAAVPFFEGYGVVALAMIAGLSPIAAILIAIAGNVATVLLLIVFVEKIKAWRRKRKGGEEKEPGKRMVRAQNLWNKYGLPGLALIGPLVVGSHITAFVSLTLGGTKQKVAVWMTASIVIWCIVFAVLVHFGVDFLGYADRPNLFN
ncbi:small multi-drug export protein [Bacillus sp. PS06]|uniref:small multi-drug export protein n=1 Tax=Bacillus sp. PS06 TaxID=2764176 RepID=UPI00177CB8DE|nr:small multi-drug export protein [Bacillus sp. PS06]MBD8069830.1 small multi-drug export protein [Bacillus sp. PS06]